jgi:pyridoxal phosphate-dependent aminotransferase EpsN
MNPNRIYLSPPHMSGQEQEYVQDAFASNWIAPLGPHVDAFEAAVCALTGANYALALASGTAAIHLALIHLNLQPGDEVIVSSLTFSASVNPVLYCGATPIFIDSEPSSWNMDPALLAQALADCAAERETPQSSYRRTSLWANRQHGGD